MELYDRLAEEPWVATPRKITPPLEKRFRSMIFRPPAWMFWTGGPAAWEKRMADAPLRFVYVVQANNRLFDPQTAAYLPAVFLATEDERGADWRWVAEKGRELGEAVQAGAAPDYAELLAAEQDAFDVRVDPALTGGVPFRSWVSFIDPDRLPGGAIPDPRVLPSLLVEGDGFAVLPVAAYADR